MRKLNEKGRPYCKKQLIFWMAESAFRNNLFISFYIAKMPFMTVTGMAEISKLWVMYCS